MQNTAGYLLIPCHSVLTLLHITWPTTLTGKWYPKILCSTRANSLTRPTRAKLVTWQGPVPNLPLLGAIAAQVRSEPVLGGSPSTPYRQGLRQVSPTNGHPPEAQVRRPGRWSYILRGNIAANLLLWTYRDPDYRGTLSSFHALEVRGLITIPHCTVVKS